MFHSFTFAFLSLEFYQDLQEYKSLSEQLPSYSDFHDAKLDEKKLQYTIDQTPIYQGGDIFMSFIGSNEFFILKKFDCFFTTSFIHNLD
jgi:hypothetical protein